MKKETNAASDGVSRLKNPNGFGKSKTKDGSKKRPQFFIALPVTAGAALVPTLFYLFAVRVEFVDRENYAELIAMFLVLLLVYAVLFAYEKYFSMSLSGGIKPFAVALCISALTITASLTLMKYVSVFFVPTAFLFLLCASLTNVRTAMFNLFITAFAICFIVLNSRGVYEIDDGIYGVLCNTLGGALMIFAAGKNGKRLNILVYNLLFGFIAASFALIYAVVSYDYTVTDGLMQFVSISASVVLFWTLLPVFDRLFDVCTDFRIFEYINPKNPVLKELREKAPGTYYHSVAVAALAENCAEAIGENPMLARAAAYYHDVGKMKAPEFFIENQKNNYNPHDELIPEVSASKIIAHTKNGVQILKERRFPLEIVRAAEEHHGTSPVIFFYNKAKNMTEGNLAALNYTYDNDKPTSKISAVIMICDTVESAVRANQSADAAALISNLTDEKIASGQFSDCDISLKDIEIIKNTLLKNIPYIYHSRVRYQSPDKSDE
ncbi:MAG: HDIG domain-containing protein [Clostridiales bacterium]|nr:HDIG domain-containing protein [Clostridiales bacterium]